MCNSQLNANYLRGRRWSKREVGRRFLFLFVRLRFDIRLFILLIFLVLF
jgi:hypothetical protein